MRYKMFALILALTVATWAQTSNQVAPVLHSKAPRQRQKRNVRVVTRWPQPIRRMHTLAARITT